MSERLKHEGRLSMLEKDAKALKIQIEGLVRSLRDNLDPMEKAEDLDAEVISSQAVELAAKQSALKEKLGLIAKAKKLLGRR